MLDHERMELDAGSFLQDDLQPELELCHYISVHCNEI